MRAASLRTWLSKPEVFMVDSLTPSLRLALTTYHCIAGYPTSASSITENIQRAQDYPVNKTRLGVPAIVQFEGPLYRTY